MSAQNQKGRSIKGVLSLFALLGLALLVIPFLLTPPAFLYIQCKDSVFEDAGFEGKTAEVTDLETGSSRSAKILKSEGIFLAKVGRIRSGKTGWKVEVDGYYPGEISVDIPPLEKKMAPVSLKPKFGRIKVIALNVLEEDASIDAEVKLSVGGKQISGQADSNPIISNLTPGRYKVKGEAEGYYPAEGEAEAIEAQTTELRLGFSPKLKSNEVARIVLQWDKDPSDLDSHLFLPQTPGLGNRHIYYPVFFKKAVANNVLAAELDVDDTSSYGPETVTIYKAINGLYQYAVYHYAGEGSIGGTSKAKITVFTHQGIREFSVSPGCLNKWWYVLDLKINGTEAQILPQNECPPQMGWKIGKK